MAGGLSNFGENKVLDHLLGATDMEVPATWYVGLYKVAPTDAGGGSEVTEAGYERVAYTNSMANWSPNPAAAGTKSNANAITFPAAEEDWTDIVAVALWDASSGGNMWIWSTLDTPKPVEENDVFVIPAGAFIINAD